MLDKQAELPEPWYWTEQDLSKQLKIEVSSDHLLKNKRVKTIARRQDNDDVLFELERGEFAVVHLTWKTTAHDNPKWPTTTLYSTWKDVSAMILKDAAEFE